ncbi:MAG: stage 0 sporulation family protein [Dehalococcoidia bacterium]
MPEIVSVVFKEAGQIYYFDPAGIELGVGDRVIVQTSRGMSMGRVVRGPETVPENSIEEPLKSIVRRAEEEDLQRYEELRASEEKTLNECAEMVASHGLPMKLISAEYNFDGSHLIVYFSAEGKVDFRALLKEMGAKFKTRVELRQIGARDVAKILGGVGRCGRQLCCVSFLNKFVPISVRMARDQSLPLNPATISGTCGKLLCCLKYEHNQYIEMKDRYPSAGTRVSLPQGKGKVINSNHLKETVTVLLDSRAIVDVDVSQLGTDGEESPEANEGE